MYKREILNMEDIEPEATRNIIEKVASYFNNDTFVFDHFKKASELQDCIIYRPIFVNPRDSHVEMINFSFVVFKFPDGSFGYKSNF